MNASWLAPKPTGKMSLLAHRGVHQTFESTRITNDSCTAKSINTPTHGYLENTLYSMQAAIDAGADIIELDIHPTKDADFVVFHDWTLDCRTNGIGRTRDFTLKHLKSLDIGYGYTADNGQTFPFRGKFTGAMPSLNEVLLRFPHQTFEINIKSRSKAEAEALVDYLEPYGESVWNRLSVFGHPAPIAVLDARNAGIRTSSKPAVKACLKAYVTIGWSGYMPKPCHNTTVPVPSNYRHLIWGWPYRFEARLNKVGSRSMLIGPYGGGATVGIDTQDDLKVVPRHYSGIIFTNTIETTGPKLKAVKTKGDQN